MEADEGGGAREQIISCSFSVHTTNMVHICTCTTAAPSNSMQKLEMIIFS